MLLGGTTQTKVPQFLGVTILKNHQKKNKEKEAPNKLFEVLGKAFLIMFERRARLELLMQFTKAKVD